MADTPVSTASTNADLLRLEAHKAREPARALARRVLEEQTRAKALTARALETQRESERALKANTALRRTIAELVVRLRQLGEQPETVVVAIKAMSDEVARDVAAAAPVRYADRVASTQDLVNWAVEAYFAA